MWHVAVSMPNPVATEAQVATALEGSANMARKDVPVGTAFSMVTAYCWTLEEVI